MSASIQWDTGYSLLIIAGLVVWIGVPVINSQFGTTVMAGLMSIPVAGTQPLSTIIGAGMFFGGILSYVGFRL